MTWNYRMLDISDEHGEPAITFAEVYYDGKGKPTSYCIPALFAADIEEMRWLVARLEQASRRSVLTKADFKE